MERKQKIVMLLLGIFLLLIGVIGIIDVHWGLFGDLFGFLNLQLSDMDHRYIVFSTLIALILGVSLLTIRLVISFKPQLNPSEIFCLVLFVTIICIIIIPLFARAREGRPATCTNNQRTIAVELQIYAQDNGDCFPQGWDKIKLTPHYYICPNTQYRFHNLPPGGYGLNAYVLGKHVNEIDDATKQLLTMDAKQMTSLIHSPEDIAWRHKKAFIAAFVDGHADTVTDIGKVRLRLNEQPDKK